MSSSTKETCFALVAVVALAGLGCGSGGADATIDPTTLTYDSLGSFGSAAEFDDYAAKLRAARGHSGGGGGADGGVAAAPSAPSQSSGDESITNNQESGVDEGDIVKAYKGYLVILRRGRLFTVRLEQAGMPDLTPVSQIDAFAPGSTLGSWYDEMLIHEDQVVVIGYSYRVSATEIGLFSIDDAGKLSHQATRFLRSNDYYSTRNYASRLVDGQLVFYMPYYLWSSYCDGTSCDEELLLPALGSAESQGDVSWSPVIDKAQIVRPVQPDLYPVLHTIVRCPLGKGPGLQCSATAVIGPYSRTFYVSGEAAYVWVSNPYWLWEEGDASGEGDGAGAAEQPSSSKSKAAAPATDAVVYRLPLTGGPITALAVFGQPIDQFSFKEGDDQHLNVVVSGASLGDAMGAPEHASGAMALMRVPLSDFSAAVKPVAAARFTALPAPGDAYYRQNRFVGDYLLYGAGGGWWGAETNDQQVYIKAYAATGNVQALPIGHGVDRIEALGDDGALVVGNAGEDLKLSSVALGGAAKVSDVHTRPLATQGETRSHGFFFKGDGGGGGVLGLPVRLQGTSGEHLLWGSAEVAYLRVASDLKLTALGALAASPDAGTEDGCVVSCVDWYGNARPIFYHERLFALLGYELVEGALGQAAVTELDRVSFLPAAGN